MTLEIRSQPQRLETTIKTLAAKYSAATSVTVPAGTGHARRSASFGDRSRVRRHGNPGSISYSGF